MTGQCARDTAAAAVVCAAKTSATSPFPMRVHASYRSSWCTKHLRMSFGNVYCANSEGLKEVRAQNAKNRVSRTQACIVAHMTIVALTCIVAYVTG